MIFDHLSKEENIIFNKFYEEACYGDLLRYLFTNFTPYSDVRVKEIINKVDPNLVVECEQYLRLFLSIEDRLQTWVTNQGGE